MFHRSRVYSIFTAYERRRVEEGHTDGADRYFSAGYDRRFVEGAGHFPQRERPEETARAILRRIGRAERVAEGRRR